MESITVTVPIPLTDQNGSHGSWRKAASDRDNDVATARAIATVARLVSRSRFPWDQTKVAVHIRWFHPTKRHRDLWNIPGALKGTIDGIVRSNVLHDDKGLPLPTIETLTDSKKPRVEITITKQ